MTHPSGQPIDPVLASRSTQGWHAFTRYSAYAVLAIIGVLCLMALFLTH